MLLVTTETIPGYTIEQVLGLVLGEGVANAVQVRLTEQATSMGANAVVGVRCGRGGGGGGGSIPALVAYGTAVVVRPA
jgi:uncharacterized protein YbjQ (UPF0145 family)